VFWSLPWCISLPCTLSGLCGVICLGAAMSTDFAIPFCGRTWQIMSLPSSDSRYCTQQSLCYTAAHFFPAELRSIHFRVFLDKFYTIRSCLGPCTEMHMRSRWADIWAGVLPQNMQNWYYALSANMQKEKPNLQFLPLPLTCWVHRATAYMTNFEIYVERAHVQLRVTNHCCYSQEDGAIYMQL
jgi:hypothetical protein